MRTHRLARLVAILLFLAAALYFLGGLIVGISWWNWGLGAGWGSGFAGWLSLPIFISTFFGALALLMFGVVLYFLAAINDHLATARQNKARSPATVTPPTASPAPSDAEPPQTTFQPAAPATPPPTMAPAPQRPDEASPADLAAELPGTVDEDAPAPTANTLPGTEEAARIASELG